VGSIYTFAIPAMRLMRYEYSEFEAINEVDRDRLAAEMSGKGLFSPADKPEVLCYADVTETVSLRIPLIGRWLYSRTRRIRVFCSCFSPWWLFLETGEPTPGYGVEKAALRQAAQIQSFRVSQKVR
jgi:hypothetical protein